MHFWAPQEMALLLGAITGLLTVVFVQARSARAEARHRDAETRVLLARIDENAEAAKQQVTNSHNTNLRDDLDSAWSVSNQVLADLGRHSELLHAVAEDVRETRAYVHRIDAQSHETHREIFGRLHALESKEG